MQGASRASLAETRRVLNETLDGDVDASRLGEDLLAVSGVLGGSAGLRRAAADPSRTGRDRSGLIDRLFAGRVSDAAQHVARYSVAQRWTRDGHLTIALEELAVEAFLAGAEREGRIGQVEDELFRFSRIVSGDPELQAAFSDRRALPSAKGDLVKQLLSDKVAPETLRLASHAVATPSMRFDRAIESYLKIASRRQDEVSAVVTTATALDEQQLDRISTALSKQYGRDVHLNVVVDPDVMGGVRVEIGDEVIEGTISNRLEDARRHVSR
ncbi:MAG: F0F1 ATP synthase subunit delta [Ornithinimicrobium sp.]